MSSTLHLSNPNPQQGKIKYQGVRDKGYSTNVSPPVAAVTTSRGAGLTLIHSPPTIGKFGKRVFMGNFQMSSRDVFDLHMSQIKDKGSLQKNDRRSKI
jgi:hypothetical protein